MATCISGAKVYYENGVRHRVGEPAVKWSDGSQAWYQNGVLHNDNGPAFVYPGGSKAWYQNGKRHNDNGPAFVRADGKREWWINGIEMTEEEHGRIVALLRKRETRLARWVYQRWYSDWMRDPHTERGQKYISKDYDRMVAELGDEGFITFE